MSTIQQIKLVECPRDAMQGIKEFIPTAEKVSYLNQLLKVGFHTLDLGSFVSPGAIPQMSDTAEVLDRLDPEQASTRLLAIVANVRGAEQAAAFERIRYLGFPFSVSETFQRRNTNSSIRESLERVRAIQERCVKAGKELVVYISMGFGNPYEDPWNAGLVSEWVEKLIRENIRIISLADTIGVADPESIRYLFRHLVPTFPDIEFGAHFHTHPHNWQEKITAAWENGCKRFDGALKGIGGCPMAADDLVGNMATENLITFFQGKNLPLSIDIKQLSVALSLSDKLFSIYR